MGSLLQPFLWQVACHIENDGCQDQCDRQDYGWRVVLRHEHLGREDSELFCASRESSCGRVPTLGQARWRKLKLDLQRGFLHILGSRDLYVTQKAQVAWS